MRTTYIRSYAYNGDIITMQLRLNTGTANTDPVTGASIPEQNTYSIVGGLSNILATVSFVAGSSGASVTNASMDGLYLSYFTIDSGGGPGAPIFAGRDDMGIEHFRKVVDDDTLELLDGDTFTSGDTIDFYHGPDGSGIIVSGVRYDDITAQWEDMENTLKKMVDDNLGDPAIDLLLTETFGATLM
jgi:hypothetical protein